MVTFEKACIDLDKLLKKYEDLKLKVSLARQTRDLLCPHIVLVDKESYYSGSYNDKAYTEKWKVCLCCGKVSDRQTIDHNYYG